MKQQKNLMKVAEVASFLNVSESAVYKWIDERRLPYVDLGHARGRRLIRFRPEDIDRFVEEKTSGQLKRTAIPFKQKARY